MKTIKSELIKEFILHSFGDKPAAKYFVYYNNNIYKHLHWYKDAKYVISQEIKQ